MLRWRRGRVAALTQSCPLKKGRQWSGRLVRWCMAIARGVLALLSIAPALWAFILALSVLAEGGPTTVSASFFAFAMFAEAASLAIAARKLPPSVWAETQGATFVASPLTLSVLANGAAIAFWAFSSPPSVLADLTPSTIWAVWLSLAVRTTLPHHHGRGRRVNGLHGSCRVLDRGG